MNGEIYLLTDDEELLTLREEGYVSEERLQSLLENHPELISGEQISPEEPRRWLLVAREFGVPSNEEGGSRWSLDHLFLDQDGIPTLVEVKRSSDSRIRREVVGQMLDYAANGLVYWPPDEVRRVFEQRCKANGSPPEKLVEDLTTSDETYDSFWDRVRTNLQAGKVRLIFIADRIPAELQRIVEFLNEQMSTAEVLALEIRQFASDNATTLVPRVIGQTAAADRAKGRSTRSKTKWDESSFFAALQDEAVAAEVKVARSMFEWAKNHCDETWFGEGTRAGSFVPMFYHDGVKHQLFALWTSSAIEIYFQWYAYKAPFEKVEKREEMLERFNRIEGVSLPPDSITRRPSIPLDVFTDRGRLEELQGVFEWYISQVRER